jgi:hypothetical protein
MPAASCFLRDFCARGAAAALACIWIVASVGCEQGKQPVATLQVSPATIRLAYPECARVRLDWQPSRPLERLHGVPLAFVHILSRAQKPFEVLRTFDHRLPRTWKPGESQLDEIELCQSVLGPALPPGAYPLTVGLYDDSWGYRWALEGAGLKRVGRREYQAATVVVEPRRTAEEPSFTFSGGWTPREAGSDRRVLARRWLLSAGSIQVVRVPSRGTLRLEIQAPGASPGAALAGNPDSLEFATFRIRSGCGEPKSRAPDGDRHLVEIAAVAETPCEIAFTPAGRESGGSARLVGVESLAWTPER